MASLPPDAASEGGSQGAGAPVCTAAGAKEEQLINLILKQIYKIVSEAEGSGFRGGGERAGREEAAASALHTAPPGRAPDSLRPSLPTSSREAEPADPSGRTSAMLARKRNHSETLKCFLTPDIEPARSHLVLHLSYSSFSFIEV